MITMPGVGFSLSQSLKQQQTLAPLPDRRLGKVDAAFDSPYGTIRSAWSYGGDGTLTWTFTIPANTTATVKVPGGETKEYVAGTYTVTK